MTRGCRLRVKNGYRAIRSILEEYMKELYRYNSLIGKTGFYLKPMHIVTKKLSDGTRRRYVYLGRYWWKLSYEGGDRKRLRWRYVGTEKPDALRDLPDPPTNPLHGLHVAVEEDDDLVIDCDTYRRYRWLFAGYTVEPA